MTRREIKEAVSGSFDAVPEQFEEEEIKEFQVSTMADAMELAMQRARDDIEEDPDPYGYAQELEANNDWDLLPIQWKSKPDDARWVSRLRARGRKAQVAKMFLQGFGVPVIAEKLKTSENTIYKDLKLISHEWRRSYIDDIEILAGKDLARMDYYLTMLAPGIEKGDVKSIIAATEIIKERGSILGYRQGLQVDITQYITEVAEAHGFDPQKAIQIAQRVTLSMR